MRSRRPEKEVPSSTTEEEENADGGSESHTSEEGKEDASGETPVSKSKLEDLSNSDSDLGSPSDYKLQPVSRKRTNQESQSPAVKSAAKKSKTSAGSSTPGGCIMRLWSDEDEATLLNGIIEYNKSTGHSFNADLMAFYRFMEGKLGIDFTKDQFTAKIRRLKTRFLDALKKRGNGEDPVFSKLHEVNMFKLSKKIWGDSVDNVSKGKHIKVGENSFVANNGKSIKKGEKAKKRHSVGVELYEKEKDGRKSVKKGETVKKCVGEVVLDEKKHNGKSVKKGRTVKKHVREVALDGKKKDAEVAFDGKKKDAEVALDKDEDEDEDEDEEDEMEKGVDFQSKYPYLSCSFSNLMSSFPSMVLSESGLSSALKRMSSIGDEKAKELDDNWKKLIMEEFERSHEKLTLMKELMSLAFDH